MAHHASTLFQLSFLLISAKSPNIFAHAHRHDTDAITKICCYALCFLRRKHMPFSPCCHLHEKAKSPPNGNLRNQPPLRIFWHTINFLDIFMYFFYPWYAQAEKYVNNVSKFVLYRKKCWKYFDIHSEKSDQHSKHKYVHK